MHAPHGSPFISPRLRVGLILISPNTPLAFCSLYDAYRSGLLLSARYSRARPSTSPVSPPRSRPE